MPRGKMVSVPCCSDIDELCPAFGTTPATGQGRQGPLRVRQSREQGAALYPSCRKADVSRRGVVFSQGWDEVDRPIAQRSVKPGRQSRAATTVGRAVVTGGLRLPAPALLPPEVSERWFYLSSWQRCSGANLGR